MRTAGLALLAGTSLLAPVARAESPEAEEYRLKAAYLYNFLQFIDWEEDAPPEADAPLALCVLGRDPFGSVLDRTLEGRSVRGRGVAPSRRSRQAEVADCQVAFVGRLGGASAALIARIARPGLLTVCEREGCARAGAVIEFTKQDGQLRFAINLDAAERARLRIDSQLLELAQVVRDPS